MSEIVIVLADLYLAEHEASRSPGVALPGLDRIGRFAAPRTLERGWRAWLAEWLGRSDLAQAAPASIAASASVTAGDAPSPPPTAAGRPMSEAIPWLATPLHLAAGLTPLHFDRRSLLRLTREQLVELALDFQRRFCDSGLRLVPLESADLLLFHPPLPAATTSEPARLGCADIAAALPRGPGAVALRRLGGEIEMWLHEHPINRARARRSELPVSTLWLWGGGTPEVKGNSREAATLAAFGSDSYLRGLWRLCGGETQSLPDQSDAPFGYPPGRSSVIVVEVSRMLSANSQGTELDALAALDRRFIEPAIRALSRSDVAKVSLLANDRRLTLSPGDRLRLWRRPRPGLEALR